MAMPSRPHRAGRPPVRRPVGRLPGLEREEILRPRRQPRHARNLTALTGDIHTFFAGTAYTTGDQATGRAAFPSSSAAPPPRTGLPESTGLLAGHTLQLPGDGQPPHPVLRLRQARLRGDRARANRGGLRAQGSRRSRLRVHRPRPRSPSSACLSEPARRSGSASPSPRLWTTRALLATFGIRVPR